MNAALRIPAPPECDHCGDRRAIEHATLGVIRCPQCTDRPTPKDPAIHAELAQHEREQLSAAEARRVVRALDRLICAANADAVPFPGTPRHLVITDGILQRWAAARTGLPSENPDLYHVSRPPELDPRTQEAVTDIVKAAPAGIRAFVFDWYRKHWLSQTEMAAERQMTRRQLGREREDVLVYMRNQFLNSPHPDLVKLARMAP